MHQMSAPIKTSPQELFSSELAKMITDSPHDKKWSFMLGLRNTVFMRNGIHVESVTFKGQCSGPGNCHCNCNGSSKCNITGSIQIEIAYYIQNSDRIYYHSKNVSGLYEAIGVIWNFLDEYELCLDCCSLLKKGSTCDKCSFFRFYSMYRQNIEKCSICQEDCYRTMLPCGHQFHLFCLKSMHRCNMRCPVCRYELNNDTLDDIFSENELSDDEI